ncbi:MAG TPA: ABC transporter permease [Blastocatellia bacterium]|nr:ABC transporter permease [Blastocatellia bacterium]
MQTLWQDLRYGARMLMKQPGFTLIAVLTLALGIGANTAIFGLFSGVLLRPLPFPKAQQLVVLQGSSWMPVGYFQAWRDGQQSLAQIAAYYPREYHLTMPTETELIEGAEITPEFFPLLGVAPHVGRNLLAEEAQPGRARVALVSAALWQRQFGNAQLTTQTVRLNGEEYQIIGVLPDSFQPFELQMRKPDVWVPHILTPLRADGELNYVIPVARLKDKTTLAQAQAEFDVKLAQLKQQRPELLAESPREIRLNSLQEQIVQGARPALRLLFAAVGFVLLIACVNVSNLLLARAARRAKETAIRAALGASRGRVVRQMLTESLLLSVCGGAVGVLLAIWSLDLFVWLLPANTPRLGQIGLDATVLVFSLLLSLATGLLFGLAPALTATRADLNELLKEGGKASGGGANLKRTLNVLVVAEIALACMLLIGAGLAANSFVRVQQVEPGFSSERVLTMRLQVPENRYTTMSELNGFYERALERLAAMPGIEAVALANNLPLSRANAIRRVTMEGRTESVPVDFGVVSADYFRALQLPLRQGRTFTAADTTTAAGVVVIDETMARKYFPQQTAVGKRLRLGDENNPWLEVVGVVADSKSNGLEAAGFPGIYIPYQQRQATFVESLVGRRMTLLVRTASEPSQSVAALRQALREIEPHQAVTDVQPLTQVLSESLAPQRFRTVLLSLFALVAMLLAGLGIYGVMNYSVAERTREIGIRVALGAETRDVLRLVLRQGLMLALLGVALGIAASLALTRLMKSLLFGVSTTDPLTFVAVASLLIFIALLACWIPARRATQVDPMIALRCE